MSWLKHMKQFTLYGNFSHTGSPTCASGLSNRTGLLTKSNTSVNLSTVAAASGVHVHCVLSFLQPGLSIALSQTVSTSGTTHFVSISRVICHLALLMKSWVDL